MLVFHTHTCLLIACLHAHCMLAYPYLHCVLAECPCVCVSVSVEVSVYVVRMWWKCQCVSVSVEVSVFKGFSGRTLRNAFGKKDIKRSGIRLAERISTSFSFRESSGKDESGSMLYFLSSFFYKTCVFYFNISRSNITSLRLYVLFDDAWFKKYEALFALCASWFRTN